MIYPILALMAVFFSSYKSFAAYSCTQSQATQSRCEDLIKLNSAAALGQCLPSAVPTDISGLLARNNVSLFTGTIPGSAGPASNTQAFSDLSDPRVVAVARVLAATENIGDRSFNNLRAGSGIQIIFGTNNAPNSRRYGNQIQLDGGTQNTTGMLGQTQNGGQDNIGLIAHELAHYIGGTSCGGQFEGGGSTYDAYSRYTGGDRCGITSYARDNYRKTGNINEEFAEVLAAYITMPQMFLESESEGCRKAFRFMRQLFGESDQLNLNMSSSALCSARQSSYNPNDPHFAAQEAVRNLPIPARPANAPELRYPRNLPSTPRSALPYESSDTNQDGPIDGAQ